MTTTVPTTTPFAGDTSNVATTTASGTPIYLRSEEVIVQAPFSYTGSTLRILHAMMPWARKQTNKWARAGAYSLVYTLLALAWLGVTLWYLTFGVLLVPYRLIRRSDRNRQRQQLQHEELMAATLAASRSQQEKAVT